MADKEVTIKVTTEADIENLEELNDLLINVKGNSEDVGETLTTALEEANSEVEELTEQLAQIELGESDADFDEISEQLSEATDRAEELAEQLEAINNETVAPEFDTSGLEEAQGAIEETKNSMEETSSTADSLTTMLAGIGATASIEQMMTTADNINNSWNRLDLTLGDAGVSMDELKSKASALSDATGRSGGVIRDYFNQMGIAGVTNTDLLSSSFEALAGKAYQTNQSIESMEGRLQRMIMTGNASGMSLQRLGIDANDLAQAMGVTAEEVSEAFKAMTPEQRLEAITKAMGDGTEANEMYKNSYAGLKDRASTAMAGLAGAVGQAILPVVIPALETATQFIKLLSDGFKALPTPVQAGIGAILGVVAIGTTLVGTLGMVGKVIGGVKTGLETLGMLGKVTSVISSISGAFSSLWGVLIANPVILVVVAIIALIAILVWAYYNVDWFREMVDGAFQKLQEFGAYIMGAFSGAIQWLGDAFNNAGQTIQTSIQGAVDFVMGALGNLWNYIQTLGGLIPANTQITGNRIVDSVLKVIAFMWTLPAQIGMIFINLIAKALGFGDNFSQNIIKGAMDSVNGFISWISSLPGKLWEELSEMLSMAQDFAMQIADALTFGGASMVAGWISGSGESSPGFMYDALVGELEAMANAPAEYLMGLITSIADFGSQMANALTQALFGVNFEGLRAGIIGLWSSLTNLQGYINIFTNSVTATVGLLNSYVMNAVNMLLGFLRNIPNQLGAILNSVISRAMSFASNFANTLMNAGRNAVSQFTSAIRGLGDGFRAEIQQIISDAMNFVGNIGSILYNAGVNAIQNFLSGLGRHSPGIMQREFRAEITEMGEAVPMDSRALIRNVGHLGEDIVNSFNSPNLKFSMTGTSDLIERSYDNNVPLQQTINIEVGTVDNEDRITEIVEAVRRELYWNNETAGRNVI